MPVSELEKKLDNKISNASIKKRTPVDSDSKINPVSLL